MSDRPSKPVRIPVPGFRKQLGLGQAVKRMTQAVGIKPCGSCAARARLLDRRALLVPMRKK